MDPMTAGLVGGGLNIVNSWINQGANQSNADANKINANANLEGVKNQGTALVVNQNTAKIQADTNKVYAMYGLIAVAVAVVGFVAYGLVTK
jgi:hypothetical protein